jgi:alanine-glyoxylate transaminase/serine-glyoxylate transaminase/serine-pyruvate transaminase
MRAVWQAAPDAQPFVVAGGGTVAMDMAVWNVVRPGDRVVVVDTGYFSDRMAQMARRAGAEVVTVGAEVGDAPEPEAIRRAAGERGRTRAVFVTHVDTSTGVRVDPRPLAAAASDAGALFVVDGVCATAGERLDMRALGADVVLTASQKAIGVPPGLALMVVSERALDARRARDDVRLPPMVLDWLSWLPVMRAYEERKPAYFSTPATNLVLALEVGLREILDGGVEARFALHETAARALRAAWRGLGLAPVPVRTELEASTLSALRYPAGTDAGLVRAIAGHGVVVAAGLHPAIRDRYFRVGHMGWAVTQTDVLRRTVLAVGHALRDTGLEVDPEAAWEAAAPLLSAGAR